VAVEAGDLQSALWRGHALAVKPLAALTLTVQCCISHTKCKHISFLSSKQVLLQWHQCELPYRHTCAHDNASLSKVLSWRYESLPRTCENQHQTRINIPHRKIFPHHRNWEKIGRKKEWGERREMRERFKGERSPQHAAQSVPRMQLLPTHRANLQHTALAGPGRRALELTQILQLER